MRYDVIFDITQTGYHQWSALMGALVFAVILIAIVSFKGVRWLCASYNRKFIFFILVFGAVIGVLDFYHHYANYLRLQSAMCESKCVVTEGIVTQLQKISVGHDDRPGEAFVVNGVGFRYGEGSGQNGFHQINVIKSGMQVRIYHFDKIDSVDKDITRLEIAQ